jgi:hypothetical protein
MQSTEQSSSELKGGHIMFNHCWGTFLAFCLIARLCTARAYPELARAGRCRLVVFSLELGGRFSAEAVDILCTLVRAKV